MSLDPVLGRVDEGSGYAQMLDLCSQVTQGVSYVIGILTHVMLVKTRWRVSLYQIKVAS